ncbi:MAG: XRE family transcriptional regulator, partial [Rubrivivax sp.]
MNKLEEPRRRWGPAFGYQEREVMEAFLSLPVAQRRVVREVILTFAREAEQARMSLKESASSSPHARAHHSTP